MRWNWQGAKGGGAQGMGGVCISVRENRKTIPFFLRSKQVFKNVTLQILNFILVS